MPASNSRADLVTLADLEADPHPALARLRAAAPVSWVPALGAWLVTGYDLAVEALGLGRTDPVQVLAWYDGIVAAVQAEAATAEAHAPSAGPAGTAAFAELAASLRGVIAAPESASLLSEAAGPLTEAEVISNAAVMMFGGIETTEGVIANALLHLLSSPAQLELVLADRGLVPAAIEESLRLEPAAAVVDRYATRHAQLGGAGVRAGDQVTVSIAGANRDPAVFGEPDVLDVRRPNAGRHLAFAHGPHFCLGAHLARLEAQVAVGILLSRLPRLRLDPRYPSAPRGLVFRKPPDLRVRWNRSTLGAQPCHRHATCGTAARSLAGSALFSQANRTTTSPRRSAVPLPGPVNATWPRTSKQHTAKPEADPPVRARGPGQPDDADDREQRAGTHQPEPPATGEPRDLVDAGRRDGTRAQQYQVPAAGSAKSHDRP